MYYKKSVLHGSNKKIRSIVHDCFCPLVNPEKVVLATTLLPHSLPLKTFEVNPSSLPAFEVVLSKLQKIIY